MKQYLFAVGIAGVYRALYGRCVATLIRLLGDLAEEAADITRIGSSARRYDYD